MEQENRKWLDNQDVCNLLNVSYQWEYVKLYSWFKEVLIPDIQNNNIRYWLPSLQMPATQIANVFIKKYLPIEDHELLKANAELRKERLYELAEKIIRVLWLNEPLFEEPIYLVRCNYTGKSAAELEYLYENNIVSICIQEEETADQDYFDDLINGNNPLYPCIRTLTTSFWTKRPMPWIPSTNKRL